MIGWLKKNVFKYEHYDDFLIISAAMTSLAVLKIIHVTNYYSVAFVLGILFFKRVFHYVFEELITPFLELKKDIKNEVAS